MGVAVKIRSNAKINLFLNILGLRADGYHELETVMVPVGVSDVLVIELAGEGVDFESDCADLEPFSCRERGWWKRFLDSSVGGNPSDINVWPASKNLVLRAAALFFSESGVEAGLKIRLQKKIPIGGGLGGGSSNAAATLLGLNRLFGDKLQHDQLFEIATRLGSDVPFFLHGGYVVARGRGEVLTRLQSCLAFNGCTVLLFNPGFGVPTKWAYNALADFPQARYGRAGRVLEFVEALNSDDPQRASQLLYNAFELPVFRKYPILAIYRDFMLKNGALGALMSGSGSTIFGLFESYRAAERCAVEAKAVFGPNLTTFVSRFVDKGCEVL